MEFHSFSLLGLLLFGTISASAEGWNNPSKKEISRFTEAIIVPVLHSEKETVIETLEFLRSKLWDIHVIDDVVRPAHEYRCSPDRLLRVIPFKRVSRSYADILRGFCKAADLTWRIEAGKIVFEDAKVKIKEPRRGG